MFGELPHLLTDSSHWAFEAITDLVFAVPAFILGRIGVRRHDRKVHGTPVTTPPTVTEAEIDQWREDDEAKPCSNGCGRMTVLGVCNYCFNGEERPNADAR